jgi:hypothetical protein
MSPPSSNNVPAISRVGANACKLRQTAFKLLFLILICDMILRLLDVRIIKRLREHYGVCDSDVIGSKVMLAKIASVRLVRVRWCATSKEIPNAVGQTGLPR